ncbi:MAG: hypothetical protein Q8M24_14100 [Pseudolabrys sp.]|nr:hypothetical protein [Pseudolabrys sp.]
MLTEAVLKSFLHDMKRGHVFDLTYALMSDVFPPGKADTAALARLQAFAAECECDVVDNTAEGRFELTRR